MYGDYTVLKTLGQLKDGTAKRKHGMHSMLQFFYDKINVTRLLYLIKTEIISSVRPFVRELFLTNTGTAKQRNALNLFTSHWLYKN